MISLKLPKQFINTVTATWGKQGTKWLNDLPELVDFFCTKWQLGTMLPFDNLSFNYVAQAYSKYHHSLVVLKIGIPSAEFAQEGKALGFYSGNGCVKLLAHDCHRGGMLLALIEPGTTLRFFFPEKDEQAVEHACQIMKKLHAVPINTKSDFPTVTTWFSLFDTLEVPQELQKHVAKARDLAIELQGTVKEQHLLHGDLHHDNILLDASRGWLANDPKGVIGETAYEVGAFMCNPAELSTHLDLSTILTRRLHQFSKILNINRQRLAQACYVRIVLSACWTVQAHGDWRDDISYAEQIIN